MADEVARASLYLDDLAIGDVFESAERALDEEQIIAFAKNFDPQPFHVDPVASQDSFFGELVASGWHTGAITMSLLVESIPFADGVIGGGGEIIWPSPTRAGDVLRVQSEIIDITPSRSRPGRAIALTRCTTLNQNNEAKQIFTSRMVVFSKKNKGETTAEGR